MAEKILNTRIQLKYDSYDNWMSNNPKLKKGEVAIVTIATDETNKYGQVIPTTLMKVGDGARTFSELDWVAGKAADVYSWAKAETLAYDALPKTLRDEIDALQTAIGAGGSVESQINAAIGLLDVPDSEVEGEYVSAVSETDGKIVVTRKALPTYTLVEGATNGTVKFNGTEVAVHGLKSAAYAEASAFDVAGAASAVEGKLDTYKESNDAAVALKAAQADLTAEVNRATGIEAGLQSAIDAINNADSGILAQAKTYADGKDEAIAAAKKAGDDAQADVDALAGKVGTVAEGSTVVGMIGAVEDKADKNAEDIVTINEAIQDIQENAYDDTEVRGLIKNNADTIALKADQTALNEEVARAKAAEKANADEIARVNGVLVNALENNAEGLDSIKELATWIETHGEDAAGYAEAISKLESLVGTTSVDSQIKAAIAAENLDQYATDAEMKSATDRITALENFDQTVPGLISTAIANENLAQYAKATELDAAEENIAENAQGIASNLAAINGLKEQVGTGTVDSRIEAVKGVAAEDATAKAGQALTDAKAYVDQKLVNEDLKVESAKKADEATHAAAADKATQDAQGNDIVATYATKAELEAAEGELQGYADQAEADAIAAAKEYSDGLAGNYATAAQGAKADSALQEITTTANGGLKVTNKNQIDIDTDVVFVFNCGSASTLID